MNDTEYEVLERFAIVAESEGDYYALGYIRKSYGYRYLIWLKNHLGLR